MTYECDSGIVILGDAFSVLPQLPPESVDMVFLDPPYFLQLGNKKLRRWGKESEVKGVTEDWDKFSGFDEYDRFIFTLLGEIRRVMKPSATVWVIGTYHNIHRVGKIMQDLGFWILNDVVWVKTNAMPNWLNVRFTNATEILIWAVKERGARGYTFNADVARQFSKGKLALNVWEIPVCSGKERLKDENGKTLHPTQKPEALLERVILTSTKEGDLILDPMAGTGTTGAVARKFNRRFILIEKEEKYVKAILRRLRIS